MKTTRSSGAGRGRLLLAAGITNVTEAASGEEAVFAAHADHPDIAVMDLGLPDNTGHEAAGRILAEHPSTRIVMVTMFDDDESVRLALAAGAIGYVVKDSQPEQIIAAMQAAAMGASLLGSGLHRGFTAGQAAAPRTVLDGTPFTRSERRVAELLMKGLPNNAVAERLGVTPKTVANYVSSVLLKLGAESRREAAVRLRGWGGWGWRPHGPRLPLPPPQAHLFE